MSVDTHTTGRNLSAYRKIRDPDVAVYVSPVLYGLASRMQIDAHGRFIKKLTVQLAGDQPPTTGSPCCE